MVDVGVAFVADRHPADFAGFLEQHNVFLNENAIAAEVGATANETMPRMRYPDFLKKR